MDRVVITRSVMGVCHMQVCAVADATDDEVLAVCNRHNPSGTSTGWSHVEREGSDRPPVTCADDPCRVHLIVGC